MYPFPAPMIVTAAAAVVPATTVYDTPGSNSYTVQPYNQMIVERWGGGGSGYGNAAGTDGGGTTFGAGTAGGGKAGTVDTGGAGGIASGGDVNSSGFAGGGVSGADRGYGGASPNGGNQQTTIGLAGNAPGGGGASGKRSLQGTSPGGGGGAYCKTTYTPGAFAIGATITFSVGMGGVAAGNGAGNGANGRVKITVS